MKLVAHLLCVLSALFVISCQVTLPVDQIACRQPTECPASWTCMEEMCRPPGFVADASTDGSAPLDSSGDTGPDPDVPDAVEPPTCPQPADDVQLRIRGSRTDSIRDLVVVSDGYILVGDAFSPTLSVGCTEIEGSSGFLDGFAIKVDRFGMFQWSRRFGSTSTDVNIDTVVESAGRTIVVGRFAGNFTVELLGGTTQLVSAGETDIFIAALNPNGEVIWARSVGGSGTDRAQEIASTLLGGGTGLVCLTGSFQGALSAEGLGEDLIEANPVDESSDGFVLCVTPSTGEAVWGDTFTRPGGHAAHALNFRGGQLFVATSAINLSTGDDALIVRYSCQTSGCTNRQVVFHPQSPGYQTALRVIPRADDLLVLVLFQNELTIAGQTFQSGEVARGSFYLASIANDGSINWVREFSGGAMGPAALYPSRMALVGEEIHVVGSLVGTYTPSGAEVLNFVAPDDFDVAQDGFHVVANGAEGADGAWLRATQLGSRNGSFCTSVRAVGPNVALTCISRDALFDSDTSEVVDAALRVVGAP